MTVKGVNKEITAGIKKIKEMLPCQLVGNSSKSCVPFVMVTELCIFTVKILIRIITNTVCSSLLIQLYYMYIDIITTDCYYVNIHETRLYKGWSENITYVSKVVPLCQK